MPTHAQIARNLLVGLPDGVFAQAALAAVLHGDHSILERMFRDGKFTSRKTAPDRWELVGTFNDGSVCVWGVGG